MKVWVFAVCDAPADARVATTLLRRVAAETPETQALELSFRGLQAFTESSTPTTVKALAQPMARKYTGFGKGGQEAKTARKALQLVRQIRLEPPTANAILLFVRDGEAQGKARRDDLLEVAREARNPDMIVGVAEPMREAWLLCAWRAAGRESVRAHLALRQELSLDPCREPERLNAKSERELRHPKYCIRRLAGPGVDGQEAALLITPLDEMKQRGEGCGLTSFLDLSQEVLVRVAASAG